MLETLSGDGISSVLLIMGVCAATRAVTGNLDTHTPCKYPAFPVPIPGVHIEVVYGTRGCPGTRDGHIKLLVNKPRLELIYVPTTGMYGTIERHEVNLRRVGSHPRDNSRYCSY